MINQCYYLPMQDILFLFVEAPLEYNGLKGGGGGVIQYYNFDKQFTTCVCLSNQNATTDLGYYIIKTGSRLITPIVSPSYIRRFHSNVRSVDIFIFIFSTQSINFGISDSHLLQHTAIFLFTYWSVSPMGKIIYTLSSAAMMWHNSYQMLYGPVNNLKLTAWDTAISHFRQLHTCLKISKHEVTFRNGHLNFIY